jgi:hypothetical protein
MIACMMKPTASSQHNPSKIGRTRGLFHSGSMAIGSAATTSKIAVPVRLMTCHWLSDLGTPNMPTAPPKP